jgi:hypothetical protein
MRRNLFQSRLLCWPGSELGSPLPDAYWLIVDTDDGSGIWLAYVSTLKFEAERCWITCRCWRSRQNVVGLLVDAEDQGRTLLNYLSTPKFEAVRRWIVCWHWCLRQNVAGLLVDAEDRGRTLLDYLSTPAFEAVRCLTVCWNWCLRQYVSPKYREPLLGYTVSHLKNSTFIVTALRITDTASSLFSSQ